MSWTHEHTWKLAAEPHAVFAALTEPAQLRQWFAEAVEIGGDVGAPYRFWGRHSLDTSTPTMATQIITRWQPHHALAYTWIIGGVETAVSIVLSAEGEGTQLLLHHAVLGELPYPRERELIDDHWRWVFGNLAAQLAGGAGIVLPDFTDPAPTVTLSITINAPRERVFHAMVTPALVNQWLGSTEAVVQPHVGGRFSVGWKYQVRGVDVVGGPTRILEYVEPEQLVLDWPDWRGDASVTGQTISFSLESVGEQTRVAFVHAGFTRTADIGDYPFGWDYFLGQLRAAAEAPAQ